MEILSGFRTVAQHVPGTVKQILLGRGLLQALVTAVCRQQGREGLHAERMNKPSPCFFNWFPAVLHNLLVVLDRSGKYPGNSFRFNAALKGAGIAGLQHGLYESLFRSVLQTENLPDLGHHHLDRFGSPAPDIILAAVLTHQDVQVSCPRAHIIHPAADLRIIQMGTNQLTTAFADHAEALFQGIIPNPGQIPYFLEKLRMVPDLQFKKRIGKRPRTIHDIKFRPQLRGKRHRRQHRPAEAVNGADLHLVDAVDQVLDSFGFRAVLPTG